VVYHFTKKEKCLHIERFFLHLKLGFWGKGCFGKREGGKNWEKSVIWLNSAPLGVKPAALASFVGADGAVRTEIWYLQTV
jgi:hypothetical protein